MNLPPVLPPEAPESLELYAPPQPNPVARAFFDLLQDRLLLILFACALVANVLLFGYLIARFNNLPDPLPLHFDTTGLPDRIESKNGIFALPMIGFSILILNTGLGLLLHQRERAATVLLTVGTLGIQTLLWIAIINIAGIV